MNRRSGGKWLIAAWLLLAGLASCGEAQSPFAAADEAAIPPGLRESRRGTYAVSLAPAGTLHLDRPPATFVAHRATEAEIALALGREDGLLAMFDRDFLLDSQRMYYEQIPGFAPDLEGVTDLQNVEGVDKERLYEVGAEIHLVDPRMPVAWWGWSPGDVAEIAENVGPFFGNFIRLSDRWGPPYPLVTLDELFAKYAKLFQEEARYRALAAFRDALVERVQAQLPPPKRRPRVCFISMASDPARGQFYILDMDQGGSWTQHYRELGLAQAELPASAAGDRGGLAGYETLLATDPEVIVVEWATTLCDGPEDFERRIVAPLAEHPLGARLQAVRHGRVLPGGSGDQGPITHLFQLEMMAKQLFPKRFGDWRWAGETDQPLFDRGELGRVLTSSAAEAADGR